MMSTFTRVYTGGGLLLLFFFTCLALVLKYKPVSLKLSNFAYRRINFPNVPESSRISDSNYISFPFFTPVQ